MADASATEPASRLCRFEISGAESPRLQWAVGMNFQLPHEVLSRSGFLLVSDSMTPPFIPADRGVPIRPEGAAEALRLRNAFTDARPASSRLPIHYHAIPASVRMLAAKAIGWLQRGRQARWASFPGWPLDLSADLLADLAGEPASPFAVGRTPVVLSHDLDSPEGLRNLVTFFLDMEEKVGARSTSFVVPRAWPLDHGLLDEAKRRGHELGIHGFDHRNRTPYCDANERRARVEGARELKDRYGCTGYRAPSLCRTRPLLRDLATLYEYDASIPTSGGLFPVPNNGCASARPFRVEGIWELPLSLPRDGSLRFFGHSPEEIGALWIECAEAVARSGGVVVLLAHCEERFSGSEKMRAAYQRFLEHCASSGRFRFATAREVVAQAKGEIQSGAR